MILDAEDHIQVGALLGDCLDVRPHGHRSVVHTVPWVEETATLPRTHDGNGPIREAPRQLLWLPARTCRPMAGRAPQGHPVGAAPAARPRPPAPGAPAH